jgi:hypothetical protein
MTAIAIEEGTCFDRQGLVHDIAIQIVRQKYTHIARVDVASN